MKLHDLADEKDIQAVAERMWDIVQERHLELKKVIDEVVADRRLDRDDLIHAGFNFGAAYALSELMQGNIREIHNG